MKCCICGREFKTDKNYWGNDSAPLFADKEYKKRLCCNECNENVVIPAREFYDPIIRNLQYNKCDGSWYAACRELFKNKTIKSVAKDIPEVKEYLKRFKK